MTIPTLFFSFLIYLSESHGGDNCSKTTKARNLKFGQIISLYMNLRPSNFGGATSRGLGHMHPKLVTAKFIKWFWSRTCTCCLGRMVKGASAEILRPGFNSVVGHCFYYTNILLNLAIFIFHYAKVVYNIFCLTLYMIRGYQVSFSVKTSQKSPF